MPSSFSSRLRLELQATGENAGLWGNILNNQAGTLLESAIAGYRTVALPDINYTLSALNGSDDEARYAFITFTGTLTAQRTVTVPTASKIYRVLNNTNRPLTIKTALGTGVDIPVGASTTLYSNGVNVLNAMNFIANLTSTTVSTGTLVLSGVLTATSATFSGQITSTVANGTAPFVVASSTPVANLSIGGNAGTATSATILQTARTINGVSFNGSENITVTANTPNTLTLAVLGTGLSGSATFNGGAATTFTVNSNATSANTASTIVARDASGNFSAGTITASLSGNATTATTAANGGVTSVNGETGAVILSSGIRPFATFALATAAFGTLVAGQFVDVITDETRASQRSLYQAVGSPVSSLTFLRAVEVYNSPFSYIPSDSLQNMITRLLVATNLVPQNAPALRLDFNAGVFQQN